MRLRMKETKAGSPNGIHIFSYYAGQEYSEESAPHLSPGLAEIFLAEGWAEEVASEAATFPDAAATPVAAPAASEPVASPPPAPAPAAAPENPLAPPEKPAASAPGKKSVGATEPPSGDSEPA